MDSFRPGLKLMHLSFEMWEGIKALPLQSQPWIQYRRSKPSESRLQALRQTDPSLQRDFSNGRLLLASFNHLASFPACSAIVSS